ncbi:MAG: hypothetical protein IH623_25510 [Verrucomicrobia bacterium]|nr:hypothetical protein [Verrucomicrobiota bacterium]
MRNYPRLSLTPALSRWERENCRQTHYKSSDAHFRMNNEYMKRAKAVPSPSGRG